LTISKQEKRLELQENQLMEELSELENQICNKVSIIINSKWLAPIIMREVEKIIKQRDHVWAELDDIWTDK
jgi:chaperonin cofactor prefoldin